MTPPTTRDRILGSLPLVILLWGLTAISGFQAWQGEVSYGLPIVFGFVAIAATNARARVRQSELFNKDWEAMGRTNRGGKPFKNSPLAILLGAILWIAMAAGVFVYAIEPETRPLAALAGAGIALPIIVWALRSWRKGAKKAYKDVAVSQCMKIPRNSPTVQNAYRALPDYCVQMFQAKR